jgi:hypothetical protein
MVRTPPIGEPSHQPFGIFAANEPFSLWPAHIWPVARESAMPAAVIVAALLAGLVGAVTLRLTVVGIGFALTATAVLVTALLARAVASGRRPALGQLGVAAGATALLAVGAVRDAGWLFLLCVLASWVVGSLALAGGSTWSGLVIGTFAPWFVPVRTLGWTFRGVSRVGASRNFSAARVAAVAAVTVGLVVVFGSLFASADDTFADLVGGLLPELAIGPLIGRLVIFGLVTVAAFGAAYLAHQPPRFDELAPPAGRPVRRWEWAVPVAVLDLLFLTFVIVQLTVLFGGDRHVLAAGGPDYADYARQGFWQLLAVAALTLLVIAVAAWKAGRGTPADRALVRLLLGALAALALVIVASALRRMWLYEEVYGITRLRILVHAVELWLGVVFLLVLAAGVALRARWLPRAVVGTGVLTLLALAALNPDAYIADHNIDRFERTGRIDVNYLSSLSADAVPALDRLTGSRRSCALEDISVRLQPDEPWYQYNAARQRARAVLAARPVTPSRGC